MCELHATIHVTSFLVYHTLVHTLALHPPIYFTTSPSATPSTDRNSEPLPFETKAHQNNLPHPPPLPPVVRQKHFTHQRHLPQLRLFSQPRQLNLKSECVLFLLCCSFTFSSLLPRTVLPFLPKKANLELCCCCFKAPPSPPPLSLSSHLHLQQY
jgi:hypothetical protein